MRSSLRNVLLAVAPGALCGSASAEGAVTFGRDLWALGLLTALLLAGLGLFGRVAAARAKAVSNALALAERNRELQARTDELTQAKLGTDVLMERVGQGLALVDAENAIGPQYSRELETIFERGALAGQDFLELFEGLIPAADYDATRRFMTLFFNPAKNERQVAQVNPLDEIDLAFPLEAGGFKTKTIAATFRRIMHGGKVGHAFVAISDVTERAAAARALRRTLDSEASSSVARASRGAAAGGSGLSAGSAAGSFAAAPPGAAQPGERGTGDLLGGELAAFAQRIARNRGIRVALSAQLGALDSLAAAQRRGVKDVLIQLVRNSLAHGIETPAERTAAGKAPAGAISIAASRDESGALRLRYSDDGRGLDPALLRKRALEGGVIGETAQIDDASAVGLIFRPGFTTLEPSDEVAGRGIGMDIIKQHVVDEAHGEISIRSDPGRYLEFELTFPAFAPVTA